MSKRNNKLLRIANYKTEMCENFQDGNCEFGSKCDFAHSEKEKRMKIICDTVAKGIKCNNFKCDLLHINPTNSTKMFDELYETRYDIEQYKEKVNELVRENAELSRVRDFLLAEQAKLLHRVFELENTVKNNEETQKDKEQIQEQIQKIMVQDEIANKLLIIRLQEKVNQLESLNREYSHNRKRQYNQVNHANYGDYH